MTWMCIEIKNFPQQSQHCIEFHKVDSIEKIIWKKKLTQDENKYWKWYGIAETSVRSQLYRTAAIKWWRCEWKLSNSLRMKSHKRTRISAPWIARRKNESVKSEETTITTCTPKRRHLKWTIVDSIQLFERPTIARHFGVWHYKIERF